MLHHLPELEKMTWNTKKLNIFRSAVESNQLLHLRPNDQIKGFAPVQSSTVKALINKLFIIFCRVQRKL